MKSNKAIWSVAVLLVLVALFMIVYDEKDVKILPSYKTSSMENIKLVHRKGSDVKWRMSAERATMPVNEKKIFLDSIDVLINNDPDIKITSGSGIYELQAGDIRLGDTVRMAMRETEFLTDSLVWNSDSNRVYTDDAVTVTGSNFVIRGSGLVADVSAGRATIKENVRAEYYYN